MFGRLGLDSLGRINVMPDSENTIAALDDSAETPRLNGNVAPPWLASQGSVTPADTPKAKRLRRTKAQLTEAKDVYARVEQHTIETLRPPPSLATSPTVEQGFARDVHTTQARVSYAAIGVSLLSLAISITTIITSH